MKYYILRCKMCGSTFRPLCEHVAENPERHRLHNWYGCHGQRNQGRVGGVAG